MEHPSILFTPQIKVNRVTLDVPMNSDPNATKFLSRLLNLEDGRIEGVKSILGFLILLLERISTNSTTNLTPLSHECRLWNPKRQAWD